MLNKITSIGMLLTLILAFGCGGKKGNEVTTGNKWVIGDDPDEITNGQAITGDDHDTTAKFDYFCDISKGVRRFRIIDPSHIELLAPEEDDGLSSFDHNSTNFYSMDFENDSKAGPADRIYGAWKFSGGTILNASGEKKRFTKEVLLQVMSGGDFIVQNFGLIIKKSNEVEHVSAFKLKNDVEFRNCKVSARAEIHEPEAPGEPYEVDVKEYNKTTFSVTVP